LKESKRISGLYARSTRYIKTKQDYRVTQGAGCKKAESFPTSGQRRTGGSGGSNRRRLGHPGARLSWGEGRGGLGDFREELTDSIDTEWQPDFDGGRRIAAPAQVRHGWRHSDAPLAAGRG
jgi:hypothetical protein